MNRYAEPTKSVEKTVELQKLVDLTKYHSCNKIHSCNQFMAFCIFECSKVKLNGSHREAQVLNVGSTRKAGLDELKVFPNSFQMQHLYAKTILCRTSEARTG